jgi:hypothetical protein
MSFRPAGSMLASISFLPTVRGAPKSDNSQLASGDRFTRSPEAKSGPYGSIGLIPQSLVSIAEFTSAPGGKRRVVTGCVSERPI